MQEPLLSNESNNISALSRLRTARQLHDDASAKPVKTLATIEGENEQLRRLVTRLQDRVATLETIATDPAERTAREIESLRALPPAKDGSEN